MISSTTIELAANDAGLVEQTARDIKKSKLAEALRWWKTTTDQYDELDKHRKRMLATLEEMSRKIIPEMMSEEGVKTITLDDVGYRFTVSQRFSCSMPEKELGMQWLRDNGLGDLIQETVNSGTLSSAVKKRIEDDGMDVPAELFNTNYMSYTSATKVK